MDGITPISGEYGASGAMGQVNIAMLNKSQDLVKNQMDQILGSIPKSANLPGVGENVDVFA